MYSNDSIVDLYLQGKTAREIAEICSFSKSKVSCIVKNAGVSRSNKTRQCVLEKRAKTCPEFERDFVSYLDGLILSDGSLVRPSKNTKTSCYIHDSVTKNWLNAVSKEFKKNAIICSVANRKRKGHYQLRSFRYDKFYEQYVRWYPDFGEKRIPRDIDIFNKMLLKNWIYGDGTKGNDFRFCTDSFCLDDIDFLSERLDEIGFTFKKTNMGLSKEGKVKYRLSICNSNGLLEFFEYVGLADIKDFCYKWPKVKKGLI
jgi:hypothetical protein